MSPLLRCPNPQCWNILAFFWLLMFVCGCNQQSKDLPVAEKNSGGSPSEVNQTSTAPISYDYHQSPEFSERTQIGAWPNLAGPYFNSTSTETQLTADRIGNLEQIWSEKVGSGYSTPIVGIDELYLFHRDGDLEIVECRGLGTGSLKWQFQFPTAYECPVEYSNGPYSTPALDENRIYALGTEAKLYAIDRKSGELAWIRDLQTDYEPLAWDFPVGSSPLVIDGVIYLNLGGTKGDSTVVALNANDGKTIWSNLNDGRSYATPRLMKVGTSKHLVVLSDQFLSLLSPENGELRWQTEFGVKKSPNRVNAVSPLIVGNKIIATSGPGGGVICVEVPDSGEPQILWQDRRNLDSQFNNIVCVNQSIYGFTSKWNRQAQLRKLSLATGEIEWEWGSDLMRGSLIAADGKLYLWGEDGHFAVLQLMEKDPQVLVPTEEPLMSSPCYSAPVIADGKLILRNEEKVSVWQLKAVSEQN